MNIIRKKLDELQRPTRNVRMHTDKQIQEFKRSVEMFGQIRPIVIDEDGVILAGNGLYDTLLAMGRTEADCCIAAGLTEAGKKKLMLADNRIFSLGVDDLAAFDAFVLELRDDLDIPGFDDDLLKSLVAEADNVGDTLREYGTIDQQDADNIRERAQREAPEDAVANPDRQESASSLPSDQDNHGEHGGDDPDDRARRFILCPKCGAQVWL